MAEASPLRIGTGDQRRNAAATLRKTEDADGSKMTRITSSIDREMTSIQRHREADDHKAVFKIDEIEGPGPGCPDAFRLVAKKVISRALLLS